MLVNVNGIKLELDEKRKGIDSDLIKNGIREKFAYYFLMKYLNKDDVVLDIGANIGYYSLSMSKRVKNVIACEPVTDNYNRLKNNIRLNKVKNIKTLKIALGDTFKYDTIFLNKCCNLCSFNIKSDKGEIVKVSTVDLLNKDYDFNFLRMDAEGYEFEILKGAEKFLKKDNIRLMIEVHPHLLSDKFSDFVKIIIDNNFKCDFMAFESKSNGFFIKAYQKLRFGIPFVRYDVKDWVRMLDDFYGWCPNVFFSKKA